MPKGNSVVRDVFGELLETGKATVKAGAKAVGSVTSQAVKVVSGHKPSVGGQQPVLPRQDVSGLDWLEKMAPSQKPTTVAGDEDKQQKEQIKRLSEMDKRRSQQAYEEVQRQIQLVQREKASQPRKYVTGAAGFDQEQVKSPETFFEKVKKKKEEMSKKLPWTSKQGMGTGEITRGVSG